VRLDLIRQPYGPCPSALEAAAQPGLPPAPVLADALRHGLSRHFRVPADHIHLVPSCEAVIHAVVENNDGPIVEFPPSSLASGLHHDWPEREHVKIVRGVSRHFGLGIGDAVDLPASGVAIIDSPADPLGSQLCGCRGELASS
jgi:hypothetical protein